jgi:hypothetical protein
MIVSGLTNSEFKRKHANIDPSYTKEVLDAFGRRFIVLIASGIGIILLSVILLVAFLPGNDETAALFGSPLIGSVALAVFMFLIALGSGVIVYAGMQKSKYDLSEFTCVVAGSAATQGTDGRATQGITPSEIRRSQITGTFCGIIMVTATIVFLVIGLTFGNGFPFESHDVLGSGFMYSWIAFPIGGLLCGIVAMIVNAIFSSKDELIAEMKKENPWVKVENGDESRDDE